MARFMANNVFTQEERELLKSVKNKKFLSFEFGDFFHGASRVNDKIRFNFEDISFELHNSEETVTYFGEDEEFSLLWLLKVDNTKPFVSYCSTDTIRKVDVNDVVTSIEICEDIIKTVSQNNETDFDNVKLDKALIIRTKSNVYMFYTDWVCGEEIFFCNHDDYEKCYPSEDLKESFGSETGYNVTLERKRVTL